MGDLTLSETLVVVQGVMLVAGLLGTLKFYKWKIDEQASRCQEKHKAFFGETLGKIASDVEYTKKSLDELHKDVRHLLKINGGDD